MRLQFMVFENIGCSWASVPFLQLPSLNCSDHAASHASALSCCLAIKMLPNVLIAIMATLADMALIACTPIGKTESLQGDVTELSGDTQGCT